MTKQSAIPKFFFLLLTASLVLSLFTGCSQTETPDTSTEASSEVDTPEESTVPAMPTEEPSTEDASTELEPTSQEETIEVPTAVSGEPLFDAALYPGLGGENCLMQLLPGASFTFQAWYLNGANLQGDFYYKDYTYPIICDFSYTLYAEPSLDAAQTTVAPLTVMYAKATDRLHWIYLESEDQSICGWMAIQRSGYDFKILSPDETEEHFLQDIISASAQGGVTPWTGSLSLDAEFVADLEAGDIRRLTFENDAALKAYMEQHAAALSAETDLSEVLAHYLHRDHADDAATTLIFFVDAYAAPQYHFYDTLAADGQKRFFLYQYYDADSLISEPTAYFHIISTSQEDFWQDEDFQYYPVVYETAPEDM